MRDPKLGWIPSLSELQLDIVGIVAILGEGCITRTSQASALSWLHVIPRLLPAPQALLKHEQEAKLPAHPGFVVGIYSGNFKAELNFFTYLMHHEPLARNEVQLLRVTRKPVEHPHDEFHCMSCENHRHCRLKQAFRIKTFGFIGILSLVGAAMVVGLTVGSVVLRDGFALLATLLLAVTSSVVGYASWWNLEFEEEQPKKDRKTNIPEGDVVIYYPTGAFRVVRCEEEISRLYFKSEVCRQVISDNLYRFLALVASAFLMAGLLCMSNAHIKMQISLAACYISLNMLHWAVSAMKPYKHWEHDYEVKVLNFEPPRQRIPQVTVATGVRRAHDTALLPATVFTRVALEACSAPVTQGVQSQTSSTSKYSSATAKTTKSNSSTNSQQDVADTDHVTPSVVQSEPSSSTHDFSSSQSQDESILSQRHSTNHPPIDVDQAKDRLRRRVHTDLEADKHREVETLAASHKRGAIRSIIHRATTVAEEQSTPETKEDRRFTAALWQVIALTANGQWLHRTDIAPQTPVWTKWINEAHHVAKLRRGLRSTLVPAWIEDPVKGVIRLPKWDYQGALNRLLREQFQAEKQRPRLFDVVMKSQTTEAEGFILPDNVIVRLRYVAHRARERVRIRQTGVLINYTSLSAMNGGARNPNAAADASAVSNPIKPIVKGMRQMTLKTMFARKNEVVTSNRGSGDEHAMPLESLRANGSQEGIQSILPRASDEASVRNQDPTTAKVVKTV